MLKLDHSNILKLLHVEDERDFRYWPFKYLYYQNFETKLVIVNVYISQALSFLISDASFWSCVQLLSKITAKADIKGHYPGKEKVSCTWRKDFVISTTKN